MPVLYNPKADSFRSGSHQVISFGSNSVGKGINEAFTIRFSQMSLQGEASTFGLAALDDLDIKYKLSSVINISAYVIEICRDRIVMGVDGLLSQLLRLKVRTLVWLEGSLSSNLHIQIFQVFPNSNISSNEPYSVSVSSPVLNLTDGWSHSVFISSVQGFRHGDIFDVKVAVSIDSESSKINQISVVSSEEESSFVSAV